MIPNITASTIYSTLGNNSSLVPLAIKDVANSCGLTAASYIAGDTVEGKDRFIDEFGTQAIWLGGIPAYKFLLDKIMFKPAKIDPNVDVRLFKNPEILAAAKEFAPTKAIKESIEYATSHQKLAKGLSIAKFAASTLLTTLTYFGLTKFRHQYTENQIKKDYLAKHPEKQDTFTGKTNKEEETKQQNKAQNPAKVSFTGGVQDFIFDPVKNLMIVDASITGERLTHARNPQDFFGYVIKEGSFWAFMYLAGPMISKALEKHADKKGKSIDLDARVIFNDKLKESFKNGTLKKHLAEFKAADISDVDIYKFAVKPENKNIVIDFAKDSDVIQMLKEDKLFFAKKTEKVDTRKFIDLNDLRGVSKKLEKLLNQYEKSGESLDDFFKSVRNFKKTAVLKNMGACIGALGILAPAIMLAVRHFSPEYQVKKDIEEKLSKENKVA